MAVERSGSSLVVACAALCSERFFSRPALRPCSARALALCISKPGHLGHPFQAPLCGLHARARNLILRPTSMDADPTQPLPRQKRRWSAT